MLVCKDSSNIRRGLGLGFGANEVVNDLTVMTSTNSTTGESFDCPNDTMEVNSPEFSPTLVEVMPLRGVDATTGEELAIVSSRDSVVSGERPTTGSNSGSGRWTAIDVSSIVNEADILYRLLYLILVGF
ncbi:hypothetical protein Adt_10898 [Abeliophyllum distichum]|uniref:Uncharacterized protein n=1 Tax=Abeliophyllum distichum TaxID=126358 RepID=A0ABD1ULC8_9LAMI